MEPRLLAGGDSLVASRGVVGLGAEDVAGNQAGVRVSLRWRRPFCLVEDFFEGSEHMEVSLVLGPSAGFLHAD